MIQAIPEVNAMHISHWRISALNVWILSPDLLYPCC